MIMETDYWNIVLFRSGVRMVRKEACTIIKAEDLSNIYIDFMNNVENMSHNSFEGRMGEGVGWFSKEGQITFDNIVDGNLVRSKNILMGLFLVDMIRGGDIGIIEKFILNENRVTGSSIDILVRPLIDSSRIPEVAINMDIKRAEKIAGEFYIKEADINWIAAVYGDKQ